jgi:hypothetical protein
VQHQPQRIRKPKLLRSNPLRLGLIRQGTRPSDIEFDDEDIIVSTRRATIAVFDIPGPDDELSDYVLDRLQLAREMAMLKYQEKWG